MVVGKKASKHRERKPGAGERVREQVANRGTVATLKEQGRREQERKPRNRERAARNTTGNK